ncbi:hypothetical protein NQZ68_011347 [Dissostichus eleginoides]|nr:hypothetical protein NQZ68_011347 [Dissostichus eleginoides]
MGCKEESKCPVFSFDSSQGQEDGGAVRLQDMSSVSDALSDRRRSLLVLSRQMNGGQVMHTDGGDLAISLARCGVLDLEPKPDIHAASSGTTSFAKCAI